MIGTIRGDDPFASAPEHIPTETIYLIVKLIKMNEYTFANTNCEQKKNKNKKEKL